MNNDVVVDAARSIRPYLGVLLGANAGQEVDAHVGTLLDEAHAGTPMEVVAPQLSGLLTASPPTARWLEDFAARGLPPEIARLQGAVRRRPGAPPPDTLGVPGGYGEYDPSAEYQPGAGDPDIIAVEVYSCPQGNYTWYQPAIGQLPPTCPYDGSMLQLVGTR